MSSSGPSNNGHVPYPALPSTSGTSAGTPNGNTGTNNNNFNVASNNATGGNSNDRSHQETSQTSATTRQTRSSGRGAKVALESLGYTDDLSQSDLRKNQQYEIDRIINNPDEALGQFHHADKAAMTQVYKQISALVHPDKQVAEWKDKANEAQQSKLSYTHQKQPN